MNQIANREGLDAEAGAAMELANSIDEFLDTVDVVDSDHISPDDVEVITALTQAQFADATLERRKRTPFVPSERQKRYLRTLGEQVL